MKKLDLFDKYKTPDEWKHNALTRSSESRGAFYVKRSFTVPALLTAGVMGFGLVQLHNVINNGDNALPKSSPEVQTDSGVVVDGIYFESVDEAIINGHIPDEVFIDHHAPSYDCVFLGHNEDGSLLTLSDIGNLQYLTPGEDCVFLDENGEKIAESGVDSFQNGDILTIDWNGKTGSEAPERISGIYQIQKTGELSREYVIDFPSFPEETVMFRIDSADDEKIYVTAVDGEEYSLLYNHFTELFGADNQLLAWYDSDRFTFDASVEEDRLNLEPEDLEMGAWYKSMVIDPYELDKSENTVLKLQQVDGTEGIEKELFKNMVSIEMDSYNYYINSITDNDKCERLYEIFTGWLESSNNDETEGIERTGIIDMDSECTFEWRFFTTADGALLDPDSDADHAKMGLSGELEQRVVFVNASKTSITIASSSTDYLGENEAVRISMEDPDAEEFMDLLLGDYDLSEHIAVYSDGNL